MSFLLILYQLDKMLDKSILLACIILIVSSKLKLKTCEPFGLRLFYGNNIHSSQESDKLQIYFNTKQPCNESFVLLNQGTYSKIQCQTQTLKLSSKVKYYTTYIHKCKIIYLQYQKQFFYNAYGSDGENIHRFEKEMIISKLGNPLDKETKMNVAFMADWSQFDESKSDFPKIDSFLEKTIQDQSIDLVIVNGDYGYDLDTNNCQNYEDFLVMMSQNSKKIPFILTTGNHQYNTDDNYQLFTQSFQLYEQDIKNATGINFGQFYFLIFDPYHLLYQAKKGQEDSCFNEVMKIVEGKEKDGRFVVPISHYPLACSGKGYCGSARTIMKNYWQYFVSKGYSLYIGAHYHTFQRTYPYYVNGSFLMEDKMYQSDQNYIISIVEGVAGNSKEVVGKLPSYEKFTVKFTEDQTGYGILGIENIDEVTYKHFSTKNGFVDEVKIKWIQSSSKKMNLVKE